MITNRKTVIFQPKQLVSRGISCMDSAFFDIETTGFKASSSQLYLIGAAFCVSMPPADTDLMDEQDQSCWTVLQWLAEAPQEEALLLKSFSDFLQSRHVLLHFNGNRFDIPYLEEKYTQHRLPSPFAALVSVDLYQDFRPLKAFLKLSHMNQKSLEVFLGLHREDQYDGRRLIQVYRDYVKAPSPALEKLLLLHNQEDVEGMLTLTSLYSYVDFMELEAASVCGELLEAADGTPQLLLTFPLKSPVPVPVSTPLEFGYFTLQNDTGKLLIPMLCDSLYFFFPDYKNYYYLLQENQAVHKSVAAYVDRQYRKPARPETCYVRKEGWFLPQPEEVFTPAFRRSYKDSLRWFQYREELLQDTEMLSSYLKILLSFIKRCCK